MTGIQAIEPTAIHFGASDLSDPSEWWYCNVILEAPGTPIDGCTILGCLLRNQGARDQGRYILVSPTEGTIAEFGALHEPGTLTADPEAFDVRIGDSYMRGEYPEWEMHIAGSDPKRGKEVSADFSWTAEADVEQMAHLQGRLKHIVCYRARATGSITIDGETHEATGLGFYEHISGSFGWDQTPGPGVPTEVNAWNWYWSPSVGPDELIVETWAFFCADPVDTPFPYVSITADGTTFTHFNTGRYEVLEEREIYGGTYQHKIRLTDRNDAGELDLVITRTEGDSRSEPRPGKRTRMHLITGPAVFSGTVTLDGREHTLDGGGFGSVYEHKRTR